MARIAVLISGGSDDQARMTSAKYVSTLAVLSMSEFFNSLSCETDNESDSGFLTSHNTLSSLRLPGLVCTLTL